MKTALVSMLLAAAVSTAQNRVPVVVELFTSEGCSSCPPADEVLSRMEATPPDQRIQVIALSEHVDYWNQLGWMDRFSSPMYTARQQEYGKQLNKQDIYTPQMIVNGRVEFNGSDLQRARQEIAKAAMDPRATVEITPHAGGVISFKVERLPDGVRTADILMAITETGLSSDVKRGENTGHQLRHTGVVRSLVSLGKLDVKKNGAYLADARLALKPDWKRENLSVVLFVQDKATRKIVGAASIRVPPAT